MIEVTRLNGTTVLINSDLIETVEETPDTVISLTTGKKFIVKESISNTNITTNNNIPTIDAISIFST